MDIRKVVWGAAGVVGCAVVVCDDGAAWCLVTKKDAPTPLKTAKPDEMEWVQLPSVPGTPADR